MSTAQSPSEPVHLFAALVSELHEEDTVAAVAATVADQGAAIMGDGAISIALGRRRRLVSEAASESGLLDVMSSQTDLCEGPALDVSEGASAVYCPDLAATELWPRWAAVAASHGWRSWFSVQLLDRGQNLFGVLSFAHPLADAVTPELADRMWTLSLHAAIALDRAQAQENLVRAAEAQGRVGLACGVLMERHNVTAEQAFNTLRRCSQDQQRKLRDVAADVLNDLQAGPKR
ncbi:GAF and ANTAR domain-containing protein [Kribbella lupini]|uniref:GAF and ANTAR domain-containing protein n=1 Tax=Kribbella lupini TaxID=291602 RepID=A0ABN2AMU0_9ACTN